MQVIWNQLLCENDDHYYTMNCTENYSLASDDFLGFVPVSVVTKHPMWSKELFWWLKIQSWVLYIIWRIWTNVLINLLNLKRSAFYGSTKSQKVVFDIHRPKHVLPRVMITQSLIWFQVLRAWTEAQARLPFHLPQEDRTIFPHPLSSKIVLLFDKSLNTQSQHATQLEPSKRTVCFRKTW